MISDDYISWNIWVRMSKITSPDISTFIHPFIHLLSKIYWVYYDLGVHNYARDLKDSVSGLRNGNIYMYICIYINLIMNVIQKNTVLYYNSMLYYIYTLYIVCVYYVHIIYIHRYIFFSLISIKHMQYIRYTSGLWTKVSLNLFERNFWFLVWEDPLEKGKATHSSILIWRIP